MKAFFAGVLVMSSMVFGTESLFAADYPTHPEYTVTPGSLCTRPSRHRYPEQIAYCERNVDSQLKKSIIREYDQKFGYRIGSMNRGAFKIDHFIPLCMGGSNERDNLWPQHKSVYLKTDHLEQELCEQMAAGNLLQKDAIQTIKESKADPAALDMYIEQYFGSEVY